MGKLEGGTREEAEAPSASAEATRVLVAVPPEATACVVADPSAPLPPPPSPAPVAVAPALHETPSEPPPPPSGPGVRGHVLAGALGAGVGAVFFAFFWLLDATGHSDALSSNIAAIFALDIALGLVVALRFGFRQKAPRASALLLRGLLALLPGVAIWVAALFLAIGVGSLFGPVDKAGVAAAFLAVGVVLTGVAAVLRRRAPRAKAPPRRRPSYVEDSRSKPLLWAGVLGGGLVVWVFAMVEAYDQEVARLHDGPRALLLAGGVICAAAFATSRGYAGGVRERIPFGRRLFGAVGFGFLAACALGLLLGMFSVISSPRVSNMLIAVLFVGVAAAAMGLVGVHVLAPLTRGRLREAGLTAGLLAVTSLYPESQWFRYALGSERAAFALATAHFDDGDFELAARYFEIACERGDDLSCMRASAQYDSGMGVAGDAKRADRLLRLSCDDAATCVELASAAGDARTKERGAKRACELDPAHYCARYRMVVLGDACSERDVFACRDLARLNEGSGAATFFYQKACSLGDTESCARAR
jgi:TPR repeat protein